MRRGSLVTPILLIVIGALFLLVNLSPEFGFLDLLTRYWPFLLVLWGFLRLVEVLLDAARSRPLPRNGITGGEWALAILICVLGSGAYFAREHVPFGRIRLGGVEMFGHPFDFTKQVSQPVDQQTRLLVENLQGNVRVVGGDTREVTAQSRTTVHALTDEDATKAATQCPLEITSQGDQIVVRTNQENHTGNSTISTDLEITVPHGFSVTGHGREGDFDVSNVAGDVELESDNAGVRLADVGGTTLLKLRRSDIVRVTGLAGNMTLEGEGRDVDVENVAGLVLLRGPFSGELRFRNLPKPLQIDGPRTELRVERLPGEIRIEPGQFTGDNVVGPVRLKRRSSDVRLADYTGELVVDIDRGDVELHPVRVPLAKTDVRVDSGNIEIALPERAGFGLLARTDRGEITNSYDPSLTLEAKDNDRGAVLSGPAGKETSLRLTTRRGDITVRKATGSEPLQTKELSVEQH